MNGTEQKEHTKATDDLRRQILATEEAMALMLEKTAEEFAKDIDNLRASTMNEAQKLRGVISAEITARNEMDENQRHYDRYLRGRIASFENLTLWGRIKWLFTGIR